MRQAERPQAQVGGGVGDAAQAELDGVDHLVHKHLAEVKRLQQTRQRQVTPNTS